MTSRIGETVAGFLPHPEEAPYVAAMRGWTHAVSGTYTVTEVRYSVDDVLPPSEWDEEHTAGLALVDGVWVLVEFHGTRARARVLDPQPELCGRCRGLLADGDGGTTVDTPRGEVQVCGVSCALELGSLTAGTLVR